MFSWREDCNIQNVKKFKGDTIMVKKRAIWL